MTEALYEIRKDQYATALRELLRHENDLTNHRIMWLLIGQGFIANAFIAAKSSEISIGLPIVGVLLTLSAFVMLYKSYQARGYIEYLGQKAKEGTLQEEFLPLMGWPRKRILGWRREFWLCRWIRKPDDVLEPWLFLPCLFIFMWTMGFMHEWRTLATGTKTILAAILTFLILAVYCVIVVHFQGKEEEVTAKVARTSTSAATPQ
ncbi:MAG TPA: hypothetical protein VFR18_12295 [Terriglobia bacterium]|nr:hypothetical protein [Terriglobia bacterium]